MWRCSPCKSSRRQVCKKSVRPKWCLGPSYETTSSPPLHCFGDVYQLKFYLNTKPDILFSGEQAHILSYLAALINDKVVLCRRENVERRAEWLLSPQTGWLSVLNCCEWVNRLTVLECYSELFIFAPKVLEHGTWCV